jgi:ribosomal protein L6P/L9E
MSNNITTILPIPVTLQYEFQRFETFQVIYCRGPFSVLRVAIPKIFLLEIIYGNVYLHCNKYLLDSNLAIRKKYNYFVYLIQKFLIGTAVGFKRHIRAKGIDHKIEQLEDASLVFTTSLTNKITNRFSPEICTTMARKNRMLRCKTSYIFNLTSILAKLRNAKKPNIYNGKGIRYRRDPVVSLRKEGKQKKSF